MPLVPLAHSDQADHGARLLSAASRSTRWLPYDTRQRHVLLTPETVTLLNGTGAAILELCDGQRTVAGILAELRGRYDGVADHEVRLFLSGLAARRCVEVSHG